MCSWFSNCLVHSAKSRELPGWPTRLGLAASRVAAAAADGRPVRHLRAWSIRRGPRTEAASSGDTEQPGGGRLGADVRRLIRRVSHTSWSGPDRRKPWWPLPSWASAGRPRIMCPPWVLRRVRAEFLERTERARPVAHVAHVIGRRGVCRPRSCLMHEGDAR